MVMNAYNSD